MKENAGSNRSQDIFLSLLAVLFIGLKLAGIIQWSWVWVLAPIWIPLALALLILAGGAVYIVWTKRKFK